jgi:uncharacterized protein (DUF927 family)
LGVKKDRLKLFVPLTSKNTCDKTIRYGIKSLVKVEQSIEDKLRQQTKRYNQIYPGEMLPIDTKRLPLFKNETKQQTREYLFVDIADFSRALNTAFTSINPKLASTVSTK